MDRGQGENLIGVNGIHHAGGACRLHADDLAPGHQVLDGKSHAGNEPAAADRHQKNVAIRELPVQLQGNGALAGHDTIVIEGMDKCEAFLVSQADSLPIGVIVHTGHQHHMGAVAAGGLDLTQGRPLRDADGGRDSHIPGGKGNALGMISRRAGNDAPGLFLIGKGGDLVVCTPELECAGFLQAIRLQIKITIRDNVFRGDYGGMVDYRVKDTLGIQQHFHRQHEASSHQESAI